MTRYTCQVCGYSTGTPCEITGGCTGGVKLHRWGKSMNEPNRPFTPDSVYHCRHCDRTWSANMLMMACVQGLKHEWRQLGVLEPKDKCDTCGFDHKTRECSGFVREGGWERRICFYCGVIWLNGEPEPDGYCPAWEYHKWFEPYKKREGEGEAMEIVLTIIDLSTECVVRLEKGDKFKVDDLLELSRPHDLIDRVCCPFKDLRATIDAMGVGEKPLPRIEQDNADKKGSYVLFEDAETQEYIAKDTYDALSELAGVALPVWAGKAGEWRQVVNGDSQADFPYSVWRYVRG